jgi:hypothetical protein
VENKARKGCLRDVQENLLLPCSLSGAAIRQAKDLPGPGYTGLGFDPLPERTVPLENGTTWWKKTILKRPSKTTWLLLLQTTK